MPALIDWEMSITPLVSCTFMALRNTFLSHPARFRAPLRPIFQATACAESRHYSRCALFKAGPQRPACLLVAGVDGSGSSRCCAELSQSDAGHSTKTGSSGSWSYITSAIPVGALNEVKCRIQEMYWQFQEPQLDMWLWCSIRSKRFLEMSKISLDLWHLFCY